MLDNTPRFDTDAFLRLWRADLARLHAGLPLYRAVPVDPKSLPACPD